MAFDGLFTGKMLEELEFLVSGRINKITQPDTQTIILTVRANRKNQQLLISAHPNFARIHLTENKAPNPFEPPMFLRVLRKHLEGGIVKAFSQKGNDRIIRMDIDNTDEIGDPVKRRLFIELMGKHSNVILTDHDNRILDSMKHLTPNTNAARTIMPGFTYEEPPTAKKKNPYELETISDLLEAHPVRRQLQNLLEGFSPLAIDELLAADDDIDQAFRKFMQRAEDVTPVYYNQGPKEYFYFMPLETLGEPVKTFDTLSALVDDYFNERGDRERIKSRSIDLSRHISQLLQKDRKKLAKLINELEETDSMEDTRLFGELITANMYQLKSGMSEFEAFNYYTNEHVTIPLNPRKSPAENAQYYYKQYNKLKTRKVHAASQIEETKREIDYLENLEGQLSYITYDDIEGMREELMAQGLLRKRQKHRNKAANKITLEKYRSSDGIEILVGKNNLQNDYLTHKVARKDYTWFHTKDIPGSHVVIMSKEPSDQDLMDAALLAAYYSKAGQSATVPVDYTLIKHVHKPSGAKPGFVTYTDQSTIFVDPDKASVDKMRVK
ncbi:Rqc2 family fibronectin-binding protein [Macrococcus carouselicus]|uniref:Rqc2 homolog RqcH n=1 Tax=Macrococcus carouselicus TaxID=69969 RepID=A0A9Q8FQP7_9STAP|nr:NFACT RNA binding domain-containing protein [Macrococcus carouselicus]TDM03968.1 fibronectin/fibrinogen-binding protein [Macrococcus carouselicus]